MFIAEKYKSLLNVDDRSSYGEVTTPLTLVNEMLDNLPKKLFLSDSTTFLDPAFGKGTFLEAIVRKLLHYGHSIENIQERVYGVEISHMKYNIVKELFSDFNFTKLYKEDFLTKNFNNMKFDVIIGNPPFNETDTTRAYTNFKGQGRNLAKMFTQRAIELSKEHILFVQPYGHRTLSSKVERDYISEGLKRVVDCTEHFPQIAQTLVYFIFDNKSNAEYVNELRPTLSIPESNIAEYFINQPGKLSRFEYEDSLLDKGDVKVFVTTGKQLFTDDKNFHLKMQDKSYGKWRTVFNCTTTQNSIGKVLVATPVDVLSKSVHCLAFDTQEEAVQYKEYLEKKETNELLAKVKRGMCNSKKYLQYIPKVV